MNATSPMSTVLLDNTRAMLETPELPPPVPVEWKAIARELLEEVDRRGDEIVRLNAMITELRGGGDLLQLTAPEGVSSSRSNR